MLDNNEKVRILRIKMERDLQMFKEMFQDAKDSDFKAQLLVLINVIESYLQVLREEE